MKSEGKLTGSDSSSVQLGHSACSFSFHGPSEASSRSSGTLKVSGAAFRLGFRRAAGAEGDGALGLSWDSVSSSCVDGLFRTRLERRTGRGVPSSLSLVAESPLGGVGFSSSAMGAVFYGGCIVLVESAFTD